MPYEKLNVWKKGMELAELVYVSTNSFPKQEQYGITSQMRRSAVSIPSNIAEGSQRSTQKDFAQFILIAKGSLAELKTQSELSWKLSYLSDSNWKLLENAIIELDKMLRSFHSKLLS